jgi:predicted ester cyclase
MDALEANKRVVTNFVDAVWIQGEVARLAEFWTEDCVNHAALAGAEKGLAALKTYHEHFAAAFANFSDVKIQIEQQIAEHDRVVSQIQTTARHSSGKHVRLATIRIDRLASGKIAEHWSVADMAGLMEQLRT